MNNFDLLQYYKIFGIFKNKSFGCETKSCFQKQQQQLRGGFLAFFGCSVFGRSSLVLYTVYLFGTNLNPLVNIKEAQVYLTFLYKIQI